MQTTLDQTISDAKQRVLDIAESLFMQRGYAAITLRDIADALGMRQASLYYHFPDGKEQLYVEMAERVFRRHRQGMEEAVHAAGPDLANQLRAIARWFAGQPRLNLSSMMHADMPALSEERARNLASAAYECMFEPLRQAFLDGIQRSAMRYINPDILAGSFLAIMDGITFGSRRPGAPTREAMVEEVISLFLDGLRRRNGDGPDGHGI